MILQNDLKLRKKRQVCNLLRASKASEIEASLVAVAALRQDKTHEFLFELHLTQYTESTYHDEKFREDDPLDTFNYSQSHINNVSARKAIDRFSINTKLKRIQQIPAILLLVRAILL